MAQRACEVNSRRRIHKANRQMSKIIIAKGLLEVRHWMDEMFDDRKYGVFLGRKFDEEEGIHIPGLSTHNDTSGHYAYENSIDAVDFEPWDDFRDDGPWGMDEEYLGLSEMA